MMLERQGLAVEGHTESPGMRLRPARDKRLTVLSPVGGLGSRSRLYLSDVLGKKRWRIIDLNKAQYSL